jgi:hypothetical protein
MTSRSRAFSKLAKDIDVSGNIIAEGIAPTVDLGGGTTVYATLDQLPRSGNTSGDTAFVTATSRFYIWNGSGWYNVALLNLAPSISSVQDSDGGTTPFVLATDGTVTTITITANDSDGDPITFSPTADSDFAGLATLSQDSSVFTITPFSQDSATTTSGTITFTATDGVNVASSGVQTFILSFISALWDETVLSIGTNSTNSLGNSTFIDRSTNAHTVTPTGSPVQTAFHPYLDNWSVEFDEAGTEDNLNFSDISFSASDDFTAECWVYTTAAASLGSNVLFGGSPGNVQLRIEPNSGSIFAHLNNTFVPVTAAGMTLNTWHHVAWTRSGGVSRAFVDGNLIVTSTHSTSFVLDRIGGYNGASGYAHNGYLSDVRIVKGTAVYTSAFTPPIESLTAISGTELLTCQNNRFIDNSTNAYAITLNGTPKVSAFNPFGQESEYTAGDNKGSVLFDTTSYLTAPQIPFGTADFTVEAWHFLNSRAELYPILFSNYNSFSTGSFSLIAGHNSSTTTQYQIAWNGGFPALNAGTIKYNEWVHFAVVRNSGTVTLYINGVSVGSFSGTQTINGLGNAVSVSYGADVPTTTQLDGYISDWTISAGTAKYTANFTPPSAPVGNTNASLYLPMDNAGIFDKTANNALTLFGNTSTSTTQTKYATTSIELVSVSSATDYLVIPSSSLPSFGTAAIFTIEFWMYLKL